MLDAFPAAEPLQDRALLFQPLRRDDEGDGTAYGLMGRVAEESLGTGVPRLDDAVQGLADDGVRGRLDDGRQPRLGLLGPPALGNVAEHQDRAGRPLPTVADRRRAVVDGSLG